MNIYIETEFWARTRFPILFLLIIILWNFRFGSHAEQTPINFADAAGGAIAVASSEAPGHPASAVIDGDVASERGWREWGDIRCQISGIWDKEPYINLYSHLLAERLSGKIKRYLTDETYRRKVLNNSPWVSVLFPSPKKINTIVVYTIDSPRYPADKYGLSWYRLYYKDGSDWRLLTEVKGNVKGRIEHRFHPITTSQIKLQALETNDVVRKRKELDDPFVKWFRTGGAEKGRREKELARTDFQYALLKAINRLPSPLKYISKVTEIEAYFGRPEMEIGEKEQTPVFISFPEGKWLTYSADTTPGISSDFVWRIAIDKEQIWFATNGGLVAYDKHSEKWSTYRIPGLPFDKQWIFALADDGDELWVGTYGAVYQMTHIIPFNPMLILDGLPDTGNRLYRFNKTTRTWKEYRSNTGIEESGIWRILPQSEMVWIGCQAGLLGLDRQTGQWVAITKGSYEKRDDKHLTEYLTSLRDVRYLLPNDKNEVHLWARIEAKRPVGEYWREFILQRQNDFFKVYSKYPSFSFHNRSICLDLLRYESYLWGEYFDFPTHLGFGIYPPGLIVENLQDFLQIIRQGRKISRISTRAYYTADGLLDAPIIAIGLQGDFAWVGTAKGLNQLDLISDTWKSYTTENGIPDNFISSIGIDGDEVWIGTKNGIARYIIDKVKNK